MQANWSLILNVLLLIGVVYSIGRLIKSRRQNFQGINLQSVPGKVDERFADDIIAVRKVSPSFGNKDPEDEPAIAVVSAKKSVIDIDVNEKKRDAVEKGESALSLMIFLLAKEGRTLAGYELLQTLLAAGLRFGDGGLFHRHQHPNGKGPVLCSLAAATTTGVFDLQNIGAFSVRGLCLFMHSSGNSTIDADRFAIMLDTARQLSDDLDAHLLDDRQRRFNDNTIVKYGRLLGIENPEMFTHATESAQ